MRALLRVSRSPGWGPARIREGLERIGAAAGLIRDASRRGPLAPWSEVDAVVEACRAAGVAATALDGTRYPADLRHLPDPPPILFSRGDLSRLRGPRVVVVGSRRATAYGRRVAESLAAEAVRAGWSVVSGMALGIDGAAHRGALDAGGTSVAVLGSGLDRPTPRSHLSLATRLLKAGCLVGELPPGTPARPHHFPRRNRILAALGAKIVVVEAARRSGALITARLGLELGREVWAVTGSVFSPVCEGTHLLLEDGARPVVTPELWAEALREGRRGDLPAHPTPGALQDWDSDARAVWAALQHGSQTLEGLLSESDLQGVGVLSALSHLELGGWVWRGPGGTFHRRSA